MCSQVPVVMRFDPVGISLSGLSSIENSIVATSVLTFQVLIILQPTFKIRFPDVTMLYRHFIFRYQDCRVFLIIHKCLIDNSGMYKSVFILLFEILFSLRTKHACSTHLLGLLIKGSQNTVPPTSRWLLKILKEETSQLLGSLCQYSIIYTRKALPGVQRKPFVFWFVLIISCPDMYSICSICSI